MELFGAAGGSIDGRGAAGSGREGVGNGVVGGGGVGGWTGTGREGGGGGGGQGSLVSTRRRSCISSRTRAKPTPTASCQEWYAAMPLRHPAAYTTQRAI